MSESVYLILPNNKDESLSTNLLTGPDFKKSAFCHSCRRLVDPTLLQWITCEEPYTKCGFMFSSCPVAFALYDDLAALLARYLDAFYWVGIRTMDDKYVTGWLGLVPRQDSIVIPFRSDGSSERLVCDDCGNEYWDGYGKDIVIRGTDLPPYEVFSTEAGILLKEKVANAIKDWPKYKRDYDFILKPIPIV